MVAAYWEIGEQIYKACGENDRAEYGKGLIKFISENLTKEFGKGFDERNLRLMRQFYCAFPIRDSLSPKLSWTHYRRLIRVENEKIIRDPYVLEFLGLEQNPHFYEKELEQALIDHLQKFLLELGRGFSFVARQKHIVFDDRHFFIDLVFYNYILKCFVLIDLKIGDLSHQDLGQMQMYVNYYTREMMNEGDNPPIGIVLCADKSDAIVKYTLPEDNNQIFASKYKLYMPTEEEFKKELKLDDYKKVE